MFEVPEERFDEVLTVKPLTEAVEPEEFLAPVPEDDDIEIEGDLVDSDDPFGEDY